MTEEERITNLEIKLSFSEDLIEELNQTVYKQQQQIEVIYKELKALKLQMASNLPSDSGCLLYTSPSPRDYAASRMPSSA